MRHGFEFRYQVYSALRVSEPVISGFNYLIRMPLMVGFMKPSLLLPPPQSALTRTVMLFSRLKSRIQGCHVPFESLKAINHPPVCHVSGELTSGNYATDDFSLETALCPRAPPVHCRNSGCPS